MCFEHVARPAFIILLLDDIPDDRLGGKSMFLSLKISLIDLSYEKKNCLFVEKIWLIRHVNRALASPDSAPRPI